MKDVKATKNSGAKKKPSGAKKRPNNITYKASDGSVTVTRRHGPYDEGMDPKHSKKKNETFRGMAGYSKAKTIKESKKPDRTANTMRDVAAERREKNAKKK